MSTTDTITCHHGSRPHPWEPGGYCPPEPVEPAPDTERDERLRRSVERNLAEIMDSEAGKRCVSCAHVKHNDLGYCQVGQCSCTVGTSLAGTASIVLRDASILLDRQAAKIARLDAVVTAVRDLREEYFDEDGHTEPEDVWRLHRDLGRALDRGAA